MNVFPAHAGVILQCAEKARNSESFPRTRGGDPNIKLSYYHNRLFSPHTRG